MLQIWGAAKAEVNGIVNEMLNGTYELEREIKRFDTMQLPVFFTNLC